MHISSVIKKELPFWSWISHLIWDTYSQDLLQTVQQLKTPCLHTSKNLWQTYCNWYNKHIHWIRNNTGSITTWWYRKCFWDWQQMSLFYVSTEWLAYHFPSKRSYTSQIRSLIPHNEFTNISCSLLNHHNEADTMH